MVLGTPPRAPVEAPTRPIDRSFVVKVVAVVCSVVIVATIAIVVAVSRGSGNGSPNSSGLSNNPGVGFDPFNPPATPLPTYTLIPTPTEAPLALVLPRESVTDTTAQIVEELRQIRERAFNCDMVLDHCTPYLDHYWEGHGPAWQSDYAELAGGVRSTSFTVSVIRIVSESATSRDVVTSAQLAGGPPPTTFELQLDWSGTEWLVYN